MFSILFYDMIYSYSYSFYYYFGRRLQELSFRKCPALKQLPQTISEMSCLKELDLRAMKKQVCKITPEMVDILKRQRCIIRGGVVKKAKGGKKSKAA